MLNRLVLGVLLLAAVPRAVPAADQGQLDGSPTLFTVLAAVNAAGYDADIDSAANSPLRAQVRQILAGRNILCLPDLKAFFERHKQRDWTSELSQYVSFALSVDGPPDFKLRMEEVQKIPPDVAPLEGLSELMSRFYKEAGIEELWRRAQPAYDSVIARYHEPVMRAVLEVNGYLRNPTSGFLGRRFQIYVDLLGAPNQIQSRSYGDDYYVMVTPSPEPQTNDIRHGYLHYLLDPLATKYVANISKKESLIDFAQGAPALEEYYKEDFLLLTTECLIKAVEAQLGPAAQRQAIVTQALREGFILTPYFSEMLPVYEKQERSFRLYYPDLIDAIDLKKETRRLDGVEFAKSRATRKAKSVPAERKIVLTGVAKTLDDAENFYAARNLDKAKSAYQQVLEQSDDRAFHAKAYYGLARIAALESSPELAEKLFRKTVELNPPPAILAWSYIYLARLAEVSGEEEKAIQNFRAALAVEGISPKARQAAEAGLRQSASRSNKQ